MFQTLKLPEDGISQFSQLESFDAVESLLTSEKEVDKTLWEISESENHAMRLLTLEFLQHLHSLLEKIHCMP